MFFPNFINIEQMINKDFVLLHDNSLSEDDLEIVVEKEYPKCVFLQSNQNISLLSRLREGEGIRYLSCKNISNHAEISHVLEELKDYPCIIVSDNNRQPIGYLTSRELSKKLYTSYQYLHTYIETILDTIDESCTVVDRDKNVLVWTKGAEQVFSVKREEIIGKPITDFFRMDRLELLNTLKDGTSVYHNQHKARDNQVVLINSNPVYCDEDMIGAVVSETDITSQIKLNKELYNASERLFNLEKEVSKLTSTNDPFIKIRGNSKPLQRTINKFKKAASTDANILIDGESGVGKELFAKAVHSIRETENAPFVAINCGAIPEALFESEIFGYEKGAFSGADTKGKKGKVELAKNGTLLLDEIGEMPLDMQVKMLRLLQENKFYSVGGTKEKEGDFRVIAATNQDLLSMVKEGKFREDLYYRLNVVSIEVPPLRKRPEDIIELTHYYLHEVSIKYNQPIHGISQKVMQVMLKYEWPGNIRELKNVVERLVVFSENGEIKMDDLPFETDTAKRTNNLSIFHESNGRSLNEKLQEVEKEVILKELEKTDGNKAVCAENLHITRATLYNRLKKLGIN
ncbi:sigma-54 interaction domain-containing protein [Lentibacillus amyloliquefaciens]|uniref:sigma-54 interaction domain-containing protein n=1 Tax=Lentibacillus amyloliquefaciens TaxID=1472767 RepID=UPI000A66CD5D|nr:sigma 54-interacting transcriptional regulator [Lentibacillus amyloliquefaciens]